MQSTKRSHNYNQPQIAGLAPTPAQLMSELVRAREVHAQLTKRILELSVALTTMKG